MADDDEAEEEPAVELGEGETVEGAPLARIASRLTWPQEASSIRRKEGDAVIRTPDGPTVLTELLDEVEGEYFDTRQRFVTAVQSVIGSRPVRTED